MEKGSKEKRARDSKGGMAKKLSHRGLRNLKQIVSLVRRRNEKEKWQHHLETAMAEDASGDLAFDTLVLAGEEHARVAFVSVASCGPERLRVLSCAITVGMNSTGSEVGDIWCR